MLLRESFTVSKDTIKKLPLNEETKLIEVDNKTYKCRGAYEFPIWRLDQKNLNERIYSSKLAENVIKDRKTTLGLSNHPKEEVDVTKTFCIERNPHVREGVLYVDAYLVGKNGGLAKEILDAGGEIGLSSSAYGDVDISGNVLIEGFELERYADWVDQPSYEVYASKSNEKSETFQESITNIITKDKKEGDIMSDKPRITEQKVVELNVRNLLKEAKKTESLTEKKERFEEVINFCDGLDFTADYVKEAREGLISVNDKIIKLAEKGSEADKLKENIQLSESEIKSLKENNEKLSEIVEQLKTQLEETQNLTKSVMAEKNTYITPDEYKEVLKYVESLENKLKEAEDEKGSDDDEEESDEEDDDKEKKTKDEKKCKKESILRRKRIKRVIESRRKRRKFKEMDSVKKAYEMKKKRAEMEDDFLEMSYIEMRQKYEAGEIDQDEYMEMKRKKREMRMGIDESKKTRFRKTRKISEKDTGYFGVLSNNKIVGIGMSPQRALNDVPVSFGMFTIEDVVPISEQLYNLIDKEGHFVNQDIMEIKGVFQLITEKTFRKGRRFNESRRTHRKSKKFNESRRTHRKSKKFNESLKNDDPFKQTSKIKQWFEAIKKSDNTLKIPESVENKILNCKTLFEAQQKWFALEDQITGDTVFDYKLDEKSDNLIKVYGNDSTLEKDVDFTKSKPKGWI